MVVGAEDEPVAALLDRVPVGDRVRQSAGGAHDRNGAVSKTDQLAETARLEARGHQEKVRAGIDVLGQYRFEANGRRHLLRVVAGIGPEHLLVAGVTGAKHDELQVQSHQPPHDVGDQVESLLIVETRDQADDRDGGILREPDFVLECQLVLNLLLNGVDVIAGGDRGIGQRIEDLVIDAVDDPVELAAKGSEQGIHFLAVFRREDLFRISVADGVDDVGKVQATTKQVDDVVQPRNARLDQAPRLEVRQVERAVAEDPLKREIVDREHGRHVRKERVRGIEAGQHVGDDGGVPVIHVDHIRLEPERAEHLQRGPAEVNEARIIVPESIHPLATEELLIFDEIDRNVLADPPLEHIGVDRLMRQRHPQVGQHCAQAILFHVDAAVARHHHPNVVAHRLQGFGQRPGHVGQPADLRERRHLRRDEENFQRPVLPTGGAVPWYPDGDRAGGRQLFHGFAILIG